jgi:hypothetical protein
VLATRRFCDEEDKPQEEQKKTKTEIRKFDRSETEITTQPQEFRSKHFNIITSKKKEAVLNIMKFGGWPKGRSKPTENCIDCFEPDFFFPSDNLQNNGFRCWYIFF